MNGRKIANLIADWADKNNVGARGLQDMTVVELMNLLNKDNVETKTTARTTVRNDDDFYQNVQGQDYWNGR